MQCGLKIPNHASIAYENLWFEKDILDEAVSTIMNDAVPSRHPKPSSSSSIGENVASGDCVVSAVTP